MAAPELSNQTYLTLQLMSLQLQGVVQMIRSLKMIKIYFYIPLCILCIALYYCVLLYITVYCSVLLCIALYYCVLLCITVYYSVLLCIVQYYCVLFCITVYCYVLLYIGSYYCVQCILLCIVLYNCVLLCILPYYCLLRWVNWQFMILQLEGVL